MVEMGLSQVNDVDVDVKADVGVGVGVDVDVDGDIDIGQCQGGNYGGDGTKTGRHVFYFSVYLMAKHNLKLGGYPSQEIGFTKSDLDRNN